MRKTRLLSFSLIVILICILSFSLISCGDSSDSSVCTVNIYIGDYLYSTQEVSVGSLIKSPDITEFEGVKILYWHTEDSDIVFPYKVTKNTKIYATLEKSITLECYSEGTKVFSQVYSSTAKITSLETPTKDGYTFDGWYYEGRRITLPFDLSNIDADSVSKVVLQAQFSAQLYITYYVDDVEYAKYVQVANAPIQIPTNPSKANAEFLYWADENGTRLEEGSLVRSSKVYFAYFEDEYYKVNYYIGSNYYTTLNCEAYAVNLDYTGAAYFYGWYTNKNYKTKFDFSQKLTGNVNVYAKVVNSKFGILTSRLGYSNSLTIDNSDFATDLDFNANYPTIVSLSLKNGTVISKYSFDCNNGKTVSISYDMFSGLVTCVYGANDAKVTIQYDGYNYTDIDFDAITYSSDKVTKSGSATRFYNSLFELGSIIAQDTFKFINDEYSAGVASFDSTLTYEQMDIPTFNDSVLLNENTITINCDSDFYSAKVILNGKVIDYKQSSNEFEVKDLPEGTYTVEIIYCYRYNNQSYRIIHSQNIVIS